MLTEINAKTILRKHRKVDSWFVSSYAINLYRGCTHNCVYCDGRDEKYQVEGEFGINVQVKSNAIELLKKELDPSRKRVPFNGGFFIVCGGVSDSYQPFESERMLCRETLELLYQFNHPVHILTKSTLVERDMDVLQKINNQNKAVVSFSFTSVDDTVSKLLEPGVPSPSKRLESIKKFKDSGINCGMYLMPVVPHITDTYEMLDQTVSKARDTGVDFIVFGGMSLKPGRQKDYFITFLKKQYPQLFANYEKIYGNNDPWGWPDPRYSQMIDKRFTDIATKYRMPKRMPSLLFDTIVTRHELVLLILEQLDYLVKQKSMESPYGYAAYSLSLLKKPVNQMSVEDLRSIRGIGSFTAKLIREICETGRCEYYEKML